MGDIKDRKLGFCWTTTATERAEKDKEEEQEVRCIRQRQVFTILFFT